MMDKADVEERKKMFDLMKDRELGGNMDWMYRGDKPDDEEFLLGKSVDKLVTEATTAEEGSGSIISERIKANVALDMQAKMREDPLFAIRKKEEDARRRLLENPVKMKQLEKLVEHQRQLKSKAARKAKKEKKSKKKKKKNKDSDSDSSDSESEDDLVNQYLTILTQKKKSGETTDTSSGHKRSADKYKGRNKSDQQSYRHRRDDHQPHREGNHRTRNRGEREDKYSGHSDRKIRSESESPPHQRRKRASSSEESEPERRRSFKEQDNSQEEVSERIYGLIKSVRHGLSSSELPPNDKSKIVKRSKSSSSSSRSRSRSPQRSSHRKEPRRHHSPPHPQRSHQQRSSRQSRSPFVERKNTFTSHKRQRSKSRSPVRKRRSRSPPKKLTAEDKERKLQEMMDNARWRDEQRTKNVQRYKKEDAKESDRLNKYQGDAAFLSSMMSDHASSSSVEDRLKRNKYNIQRTRAALDKNFTQH